MTLRSQKLLRILILLAIPAVSHAEDTIFAVKSGNLEPYNLALKGMSETLKTAAGIKVFDLAGEESHWKDLLKTIREEKPRIVMTFGTLATTLAKRDIRDIPIIFSSVLNPEESGIVAGHGGNITGASLDIPLGAQFSNLLSVIPSATRIGVLYNPKETGGIIEKARAEAAEMGLTLIAEPVKSQTELPRAIDRLFGRIDALWSVADSTVFSPPTVQQIIVESIKSNIPFMGISPSFVKAGALLSVKWDDADIGRQAGEVALRILSRRDDVSNIPVSSPRKISIIVNLRTARALRLSIPAAVMKKVEVIN